MIFAHLTDRRKHHFILFNYSSFNINSIDTKSRNYSAFTESVIFKFIGVGKKTWSRDHKSKIKYFHVKKLLLNRDFHNFS